jgi:hypothetical protein
MDKLDTLSVKLVVTSKFPTDAPINIGLSTLFPKNYGTTFLFSAPYLFTHTRTVDGATPTSLATCLRNVAGIISLIGALCFGIHDAVIRNLL